MKHRKLIAIGSAVLSAAILMGCTPKNNDSGETSAAISVIEITENSSTSESIETTAEETTEETSVTEEININTTEIWRNYISSIEDNNYLFGFNFDKLYVNRDGEISEYELNSNNEIQDNGVLSEDEASYYSRYCCLSKATILRCPVFVELYVPSEVTFDDNIADGTYYGTILGVSVDGTTAFALIGDPVIITDDLLNSQDPNSTVLDYNGVPVDITDYYENVGDIPHPVDISYELTGSSDVHFVVNQRLVILSIRNDVTVTDNIQVLMPDMIINPEDFGSTAFTQSFYWGYLLSSNNPNPVSVNGWYICNNILEPMVITDGQAANMVIGFR